MTDELTRDWFARQLNTQFQIERQGASTVTLDLVEASPLRISGGFQSFSIVFRGPADTFLPQATYTLHHDTIAPFELFIVPIGQDAHGFRYEAVFNLLHSEDMA